MTTYIAVTTTNGPDNYRAICYGESKAAVLAKAKELLPAPSLGIVEDTEWKNLTVKTEAQLFPNKDERAERAYFFLENAEYVPPAPGRPPLYDKTMRQTAVWLPEHMLAWLKAQPGGVSETMRALIEAAMGQGAPDNEHSNVYEPEPTTDEMIEMLAHPRQCRCPACHGDGE
jgi:hypothetical protein